MRSFIKMFGGKFNLFRRIIALFPDHATYVEPYVGSGIVLLNKPLSPIEVANDIHPSLMNLWRYVRDRPEPLCSLISGLDYDEAQFLYSKARSTAPASPHPTHLLHWAAHTLVVNRMSRSAMGKEFAVPGVGDERLRGGFPDNVNAWRTTPDVIRAASRRIQGVTIASKPALELIHTYLDDPSAVLYLDPCYLPCTRKSREVYEYEMTARDHMHLLDAIRISKAAIFLSGYRSDLYAEYLPKSMGWNRIEWVVSNSSGQNKIKEPRIECVWSNRPLPESLPQ
jgi:DNA adenine methylase